MERAGPGLESFGESPCSLAVESDETLERFFRRVPLGVLDRLPVEEATDSEPASEPILRVGNGNRVFIFIYSIFGMAKITKKFKSLRLSYASF